VGDGLAGGRLLEGDEFFVIEVGALLEAFEEGGDSAELLGFVRFEAVLFLELGKFQYHVDVSVTRLTHVRRL
jgi:hypothetical protein